MKAISLLVLCTCLLGVAGCQPGDSAADSANPATASAERNAPPPADSAPTGQEPAVRLRADPETISPGQELVLRLHNGSDAPVEFGRPLTVEYWDGAAWVETDDSRERMWTMEILSLAPGERGPPQTWPFSPDHRPEPGWYRFTKTVHLAAATDGDTRLSVRTRVRVGD